MSVYCSAISDCSRKAPVQRMLSAVIVDASQRTAVERSLKCRKTKALANAAVREPQKALKRFAERAASAPNVKNLKMRLRIAHVGAPGECGIPALCNASENSPLSWKEMPGAQLKAKIGKAIAKTAIVT